MRSLRTILLLLATGLVIASAQTDSPKFYNVNLGGQGSITFTPDKQSGEMKASINLQLSNDKAVLLPLPCSYPLEKWKINPVSGIIPTIGDQAGLTLQGAAAQFELVRLTTDASAQFVLKCKKGGHAIETIIAQMTIPVQAQTQKPAVPLATAAQPRTHDDTGNTNWKLLGLVAIMLVLATIAFLLMPALRWWSRSINLVDGNRVIELDRGQTSTVTYRLEGYYRVEIEKTPRFVECKKLGNEKGGENKFSWRLSLSQSAQGSGAEEIPVMIRHKLFPNVRESLFIWWTATQPDSKTNAVKQGLGRYSGEGERQDRIPADWKLEIGKLREICERTGSLEPIKRALEGVQDIVRKLPDENKMLEMGITDMSGQFMGALAATEKKLMESNQQLSESLYGKVNRGIGSSLDTFIQQIKGTADAQLNYMADLVKSVRGEQNGVSAPAASDDSLLRAALERFIAEKMPASSIQELLLPLFTGPGPAEEMNLRPAALTLGELAAAMEEIEKRFRTGGIKAPELIGQIRGRLLRLEWLAQKYDSFRRHHSLPVEIRVECSPGGPEKLQQSLAEGMNMALRYWQSPQRFLETSWDEVITKELPELVKMCDSAAEKLTNPRLFDDLLGKLFELTRLEDISPRPGGAYDSICHILLGFESGKRDTVTRVVIRGFRYKQAILQKPTVMVGQ